MKKHSNTILLSSHDLVGHLNCGHLTGLDLQVANGTLGKPKVWDSLLDILRERGLRHEQAYLDHLKDAGFQTVTIEGVDITSDAVAATLKAMEDGTAIIVQAALQHGRWTGKADILRRVEKPSRFGDWSYEVIDTKLARETKGGTVLQLSLYADLLSHMQGVDSEYVYVVAPWSDFTPQSYRVDDYAAFFRQAKIVVEDATLLVADKNTYPDLRDYCDICRWRNQCDSRRRADDHLCLVAGISKTQINELQSNGVNTAKALAEMPTPMPWKPKRGSPHGFEKISQQARIQVTAREANEKQLETLEVFPGTGLCLLPEPSKGDVFFDIEGDPYVGEHGLEYLFGYHYQDENNETVRAEDWALDRESERSIFQRFMDFITERRTRYPDLHIYHYAPYEPVTLKRLMGRYATHETEVDNLLRGLVFVDLYSVVRNAIRASVESYSIKKLEPFYDFERTTPLHEANLALYALQVGLELNDVSSISVETRAIVARYNADDCVSTEKLRDWLESIRTDLIVKGTAIARPEPGKEEPSEELTEHEERVTALIKRLTHDVPSDPNERNNEQQGRWILANILGWHRREDKATWWEYFRLSDLTSDELVEERTALGQLELVKEVGTTKTGIPTHRYKFPQQDTDLREENNVIMKGGEKIGTVVAISTENRTIDIKKSKKTADIHPQGIFEHTIFQSKEQAAALVRLAEYVVEYGLEGDGPYLAARDLLMRNQPRIGGNLLHQEKESTLDNALRITPHLCGGVLSIQGPPGTGKSFTGARMINRLVSEGKKVGITANSHKVIRHLIDKVIEAADKNNINLKCVQKAKVIEENQHRLNFAKNNDDVFGMLSGNKAQVAGATHYLWARVDAQDAVDVLFVDEAAQMSLANVLAISHATKTLVLLGDPQQLDQPTKGTHPDGTGVSALDHILDGAQTISPCQGLFLEQTWRLHPDICEFNSELFYDAKLTSHSDCGKQVLHATGSISGTGLRYLPVSHTGNKSSSIEEADAVLALIENILASGMKWNDREGNKYPVMLEDIIIITPYNAQVFEIQQRLPLAHVGTVDKFQGQEAPIAIYSMATSSHADAPRGMEFLYSANRLNVAISRAKCLTILVASPSIFEVGCKTPRQMKLANSFCRYSELSKPITLFDK